MSVEKELKELIRRNYGSVSQFCQVIGISDSTMSSVLRSDMKKANLSTIFAITKELGIDAESLYFGKIVFLSEITDDLTILTNNFIRQLQRGRYSVSGRYLTDEDVEEIVDHVNFAIDRIVKRHSKRKEERK